ncbi:tetratricopeptide repeat protein 1-like [Pollicipes pollicipes]|uniref:tetratricopeptide repeat protein 1-like n=1 Tax=Pollicipes pollicipes TaxID=41117 RepID=UPI0018856500|nr:tetratricopeptide repeat protein 1-like [Pollicipes pollicipes]
MASEEVFEDCCSSADELGVSAPLDKRVTSPGGAAEEAAVLVTADGASVDEVRDSSASEGERDAGDRSAHGDWHVLKNTTPPGDAASSDEGDASESDSASPADLKAEGNRLYAAEGYDAARERYTAALRLCPLAACRERAVLFSNRAARALELDAEYARPLQRRAELRERSEKLDEALEDWKRLLTLQPGHAEARRATARLPAQIAERNERLKDEMLGKLKDLGNMLLRPFNLSTNNFQMEENEAGGYSVKFNPT